jgi:hypothetical protein
MSFQAIVFNVMIASPGDVQKERNIIREVVHEWNSVHSTYRRIVLLPVGWETHSTPLMGDRPQEIINAQVLRDSDLLIAVFWTRLGTPTGKAVSGTVEEIDEHIRAGKPALIYFSSTPVRPESVDEDQYRLLKEFKEECKNRGLVETYDSPAEFNDKLYHHLCLTLNNHDYFKHIGIADNGKEPPDLTQKLTPPPLSREATELLIEAVQDPHGTILKANVMGGPLIYSNGKQFVEHGNPRSRAAWEGAIQELCGYDLLEPKGYKGEVFAVTRLGYEIADILRPM